MPSPYSTPVRLCSSSSPLHLELGGELDGYTIAYRTWGRLSPAADNAVIICHALTGSPDADDWWSPLFGPGLAFDPERDFIVCSNVLGGCYGSTGAASIDCLGQRYGRRFPALTIRDQVRAQMRLADELGVRSISMVAGGSMGGLQALEWALLDPQRVRALAVVAASARHSAWCRAWSETQRMAIHSDPAFLAGDYADQAPPIAGLGAARAIAMMTYRSARMFEQRHAGVAVAPQSGKEGHSSDSVREWLHHHGRHFVGRFDANVYLSLIDAMDRHDIGWKRGGVEAALNGIRQPAIVISISSDWLYPPSEQREIAEGLSQAKYVEIDSEQGHDGFLIDAAMLEPHLTRFHEVQRRRAGETIAEGYVA